MENSLRSECCFVASELAIAHHYGGECLKKIAVRILDLGTLVSEDTQIRSWLSARRAWDVQESETIVGSNVTDADRIIRISLRVMNLKSKSCY